MTIEDLKIIEIEVDARKKYAVIVYQLIEPEFDYNSYLVIPLGDYNRRLADTKRTWKNESPEDSRLRTCEHFMFIHDVVDDLVPIKHLPLPVTN